MIQGRFVKDNEVTEVIMEPGVIEPEKKGIQAFTFLPRKIQTQEHIESLTWWEMCRLALATGGTMAALIFAVMNVSDVPMAQVFLVGIGILDGYLLMKHLKEEE